MMMIFFVLFCFVLFFVLFFYFLIAQVGSVLGTNKKTNIKEVSRTLLL